MAVKARKEGDKLILELDNGDITRLEEAIKKCSFKDEQSFLRFAVSLFIVNEGNSFFIKQDGQQTEVIPSKELLKSSE